MLVPDGVVRPAEKFHYLAMDDQTFITLMKLRNNKDFEEINIMYNVSMGTVSKIFETWIMFMNDRMKRWPIWPSLKVIDETMPKYFKEGYSQKRELFLMPRKFQFANLLMLVFNAEHFQVINIAGTWLRS